jgi:hypothetical protein
MDALHQKHPIFIFNALLSLLSFPSKLHLWWHKEQIME